MIQIAFHIISVTCDRCGRIKQFNFIEGDSVHSAYESLRRMGWKIKTGPTYDEHKHLCGGCITPDDEGYE